jgi:hypothetical protein
VRKEGRMKYSVFKLKTKRVDVPLEGDSYGKAFLYYPDGIGAIDIISELNPPGYSIERKGKEDDTWEQRVIAVTIDYLESRSRRRNYQFRSLVVVTPRPNDESERTWMIVISTS